MRLSLTHDGQGTQVTVDHAQISGALLNVLLNSLAALSDGGHITLHITRDSDAVRVAITDNGTGMTDETSSSAFRPFFTTRADGTGLGLPLAKRAIQENGGTLALVRSRPGEGTEFCMSFPVSGHA